MQLDVRYPLLPRELSLHARAVMTHFGIHRQTEPVVLADHVELPIQPGDVVVFIGPSGAGKSSLLRAAVTALRQPEGGETSPEMIQTDDIELGDKLVIDTLPAELPASLEFLTACGLAEPRLLLRTPEELSEGQRYRLRLACGLARRPAWLVCDEFTATLDRTLARVVAYNLARQARRFKIGCLLATTHEDVLADLQPDIVVRCRLDATPEVTSQRASTGDGVKKKSSASRTSCGSPQVPVPTGRTSLGGITAAIMWVVCGG
ncbi:MAG: hypothetical protein KatS3mg114_1400 [Planctomycetaceae bacterium]|nr:MAG: hypothetical protein KatS3mg114_1400 [Planctomycetaceae bacterium]